MTQELPRLLERHRELAAAGEMVDMLLGEQIDPALGHNLARLTADGYRVEGKSFADTLATAKLRVALMKKYGSNWPQCPEWKAYKATGSIAPAR